MKFRISKNPYDERVMFKRVILELNPNTISCFVGANGTGKTTAIRFIKNHLHKIGHDIENDHNQFYKIFNQDKKEYDIAYLLFDKNSDITEDLNGMEAVLNRATVAFSSTGEGIIHRLNRSVSALGGWVKNNENKNKTLFVFFDDCDAGTSIDVIIELKDLFKLIAESCEKKGITYYIVITANSFEMCRDIDCISVHDFTHKTFTEYEDFKKFVMNSKKLKEKSIKESEEE